MQNGNQEFEDLLQGLNESQRQAVTTLTGPLLVVAGAGSGKTRVLTTRITMLLRMGIIPERILSLTFTRKAAEEMRRRVAAMTGSLAARLNMGTFHSVLASMLRPYARYIGFPENFTILDEDDSKACLRRCIQAVLDAQRPPKETWTDRMKRAFASEDQNYRVRDMMSRISKMKNALCDDAAYAACGDLRKEDGYAQRPLFSAIYTEYAQACRRSSTMDFDDILLNVWKLLTLYPDIRRYVASHFDYIMVDEFQDTNIAQFEILKLLTQERRNICAVGDDSQSIYAFRGADIRNILGFRQTFEGCPLVKLEANYRSTKAIVEAANRLIANNSGRIEKTCYATGGEGGPVDVWTCCDERQEADMVAGMIADAHAQRALPYSSSAVLYRTNAQSRAIEEALMRRSIPYTVYSGTSFYDRQEIKDTLAYLRLAVNPNDEESLRRVINVPPRGIGMQTLNTLSAAARGRGTSLWDVLNGPEADTLRASTRQAVRDFTELVRACGQTAEGQDAGKAAKAIVEACGLETYYRGSDTEKQEDRWENISELLGTAATYAAETQETNRLLTEGTPGDDRIGGFLQTVMLISNADTDTAGDSVQLMTVHCAKGLEFEDVYVTGLEENLFPLLFEEEDPEKALEEERRLFYVASTRAMSNLVLTWTERRMRFGSRKNNRPSRFLREMLGELEY